MIEIQGSHFLSWLWFTIFVTVSITSYAAFPITKPGCQTHCGEVTIPYPFGIGGQDGECSLSESYNIICNTSFHPPKPFLSNGTKFEVTNIQENTTINHPLEIMYISHTGQMRIRNFLVNKCYQRGQVINSTSVEVVGMDLENLPIVVSATANKLIGLGCNHDFAMLIADDTLLGPLIGCITTCTTEEELVKHNNTACSGVGCCQTVIPNKGLKTVGIIMQTLPINNTNINNSLSLDYCSAAFLAEDDKFRLNVADLFDDTLEFRDRLIGNVPVMLNWFVGVNETCRQAQQRSSGLGSYACKENTECTDISDTGSGPGYRCSCLGGYEGNPYLSLGCTDIDECADPSNNPCLYDCKNTFGSYKCPCPKWHKGDGRKNGTGCKKDLVAVTRIALGVSSGVVSLLVFGVSIYFIIKKRKLMKMREKIFEQNGGVLLTQKLSPTGGNTESFKVFSVEQLKQATNNYSEDRILGKGGFGTVYKGILKDGREVAIKKSRVADQTQVGQFINELAILTRINHRNVVKLFGCCLETEVPLLVYELVSNGTLFDHIQRNKGITSWLTWANCVRLASEVANALSYLHSAASMPVIHRDVKSSNILLDERYTAKVSDFGASRLIPIDQTQVTTLVQGTLGYLDPEYFHTSQLTEKSDVYSFGIVLAELLTKERPLSLEREMEDRSLATNFISSVKEDRLMEIIDPQLVREAKEDQLIIMANLVVKCLNIKGERRPTMKEVAIELEGLKKQNRHSWAEQKYDQATSLMSHHNIYPMPSIVSNVTPNTTGQYAMHMDMITEMNQAR